ncbi:MAG: OPT/YSL family transporter [Ignavibacteriales bacterium]|nr:OPT/YSL family transporter [Ignavibacteriales bacterium]
MYLPLETTFAIFVGGLVRGIVDKLRGKRGYNAAQKARVENAGVLAASGLIAGEALMGLLVAGRGRPPPEHTLPGRVAASRRSRRGWRSRWPRSSRGT